MNNSRLGCFTATGIIAALITAFVIAGMAFAQGGVLYSPGALNAQAGETLGGVTSHAQTGGECKSCHVAPWDVLTMADRCASCHMDVAVQMREVASLHGSITHQNQNLKCRHCHPDHRGADAPLTITTGADFPHEALGFSLAGHQQTAAREAFLCSDCHAQSISVFNLQDCQTCHQQIDAAFAQLHLVQFGADCLACHDGADRFGKTFTHNNFDFKLDGKHAQINCADCHANVSAAADFSTAPADCFSCHAQDDPHKTRFGADCAACHTPSDWDNATFDHSRGNFPLTGAHQRIDCERCHVNNQFAGTPATCAACHSDPLFHAGAFSAQCETCHSVNAWTSATFNLSHPEPSVDEEGSGIYHGGTTCRDCHPTSVQTYTCLSCHTDNQGGEGGGDGD